MRSLHHLERYFEDIGSWRNPTSTSIALVLKHKYTREMIILSY